MFTLETLFLSATDGNIAFNFLYSACLTPALRYFRVTLPAAVLAIFRTTGLHIQTSESSNIRSSSFCQIRLISSRCSPTNVCLCRLQPWTRAFIARCELFFPEMLCLDWQAETTPLTNSRHAMISYSDIIIVTLKSYRRARANKRQRTHRAYTPVYC